MDATERRGLWLMAAPFLAGAGLLIFLPALGSFAMAGFEWDLVRPPRFLGLDNFRELLGDPVFRISLRNSLTYAAIGVPLRLLCALGFALLLYGRSRLHAAGRIAVVVPTVIPDVAYALVWLWILNPLYGPLNLALGAVGLPTPSWLSQPGPARWGVVLMGVFQLAEAFLIVVAVRRL
ncbi:MAG TPA: sugar ABC transporter permease, partial [Actinomycetota bacterium]|nr:sugar ABC transporter permease [Actinomycetota bacterium]